MPLNRSGRPVMDVPIISSFSRWLSLPKLGGRTPVNPGSFSIVNSWREDKSSKQSGNSPLRPNSSNNNLNTCLSSHLNHSTPCHELRSFERLHLFSLFIFQLGPSMESYIFISAALILSSSFNTTLIEQTASFSPALTVIVTVPAATAVTVPSLTVAIFLSLVVHVKVLSVESSGLTVAVSFRVSPVSISASVLSRAIDVAGTTFLLTVTEQVADLPPAVAVIVAVPSPTAVTVPLLTVATDWLDVDQLTDLLVALDGWTVAVRFDVPPTSRATVVGLSETPVTAISGSSFGPQAITMATIKTKTNNFFILIGTIKPSFTKISNYSIYANDGQQ